MQDIALSKFQPIPALVTTTHSITKPRFPVIDMHVHMGHLMFTGDYASQYDTAKFVQQMRDAGVVRIVNLDGEWGEGLTAMLEKTRDYPEEILHFAWVEHQKIDEADFAEVTRARLVDAKARGVRGVKMWKDVTLYCRDKRGNCIRTDDPRLDVVYDTAAELSLPVLMHIGDPKAFFDPIDGKNERFEELNAHPDWSFCDPSLPTFQELLSMQDHMIESHPNTTFIIAHFGSCAEDLDWVASRLDRYPNLYIDITGRIAELGRVPYSARRFFLRYADRIVFGTDSWPLSYGEHAVAYRFLETDDEYFNYEPNGNAPTQGRWRIYGIYLPDDVLKKVYHENAMRLLHLDSLELPIL